MGYLSIIAAFSLSRPALAATSAVTTVTVVAGLEHPWGLAFLPDNALLVTERPGRLRRVAPDGGLSKPIRGLPTITAENQGGLLDIALHPNFAHNQRVYFSYVAADSAGNLGTEVAYGQLRDLSLHNVRIIFKALPKSRGGRHFGSRLLFGPDGYLYITLGDRGDRPRAQRLDDHAGSIIRLNDDGSIPADNPFINHANARPEIYTYGNRNVQGIALQPDKQRIWAHEHGPQGGDELNIIQAGVNYGWPVITYGVNYVIGTRIGEGTAKPGMQQPQYYWTPSIAPSGMVLYSGDRFPQWRGNLFVGSLKFRCLVRLTLAGTKVIAEERLFENTLGRIRDVREGPDGLIYLLTDADDGAIVRLEPSPVN